LYYDNALIESVTVVMKNVGIIMTSFQVLTSLRKFWSCVMIALHQTMSIFDSNAITIYIVST